MLVRREASGQLVDLVPADFNVRTRVHEYGGGAWLPAGETIYASNFVDQRVYRLEPGATPEPITPEPELTAALRYADGVATPDRELIVSVRESHLGEDVVNELVVIPTGGTGDGVRAIRRGADFFASPRLSPDGRELAWLEWNHPQMPWDGTELWVADVAGGGELSGERLVAGGPSESIWQPEWSPAGELHFVSDRSGWWNLHREGAAGVEALTGGEAEYGYPHWTFGGTTYAFAGEDILCVRIEDAIERLCLLSPGGEPQLLDLPFTAYGWNPSIDVHGSRAVLSAGSGETPKAVIELDLGTGGWQPLHEVWDEPLDPGFVSIPRAIEFPTTGPSNEPLTAHAFFYPPAHPDCEGPEGELPPLIVEIHGGPSAHVTNELSLERLFWTSRGFAVVDVNYGGSTGHGRSYRERLDGNWGIVDTADCEAAAEFLAAEGAVDGRRLAIHGGSAGGYTTLCALVFGERFSAGASYYGVADAETLAEDTHKFESRYLDRLIGPYPETAATYRERSPIHFVDQIRAPVIILQGTEDEVVPLAQAEQIVTALAASGVPHAYLAFEGEQHGFRKAGSIIRALEAELYFYGRAFGFDPAGEIEPVEIVGEL